jgi:hypothetical protein
MNYWTPLNNDNDDNTKDKEEINMIKELRNAEKLKRNNWTRQRAQRQEQRVIIDSSTPATTNRQRTWTRSQISLLKK